MLDLGPITGQSARAGAHCLRALLERVLAVRRFHLGGEIAEPPLPAIDRLARLKALRKRICAPLRLGDLLGTASWRNATSAWSSSRSTDQ